MYTRIYINLYIFCRDFSLLKKIGILVTGFLLCICAFVVVVFWKPVAVISMFWRELMYQKADKKQVSVHTIKEG